MGRKHELDHTRDQPNTAGQAMGGRVRSDNLNGRVHDMYTKVNLGQAAASYPEHPRTGCSDPFREDRPQDRPNSTS